MGQEHQGDGDNVGRDKNVYYASEKHTVQPKLTTKLGKDTIIGREKELQEIDTLLNSSNSLLLINGIGGIGKSTIASYYLHSQKEKLDYYGFFEGLESFTVELKPRLKLKSTNEDELFMEALSTLSALEGEKLLVFDDVKNIEENQDKIEKILALKYSGYKILLTSREEIEDVEQYYLDVLTLEDAKELFNSIYLVEDEAVLEEILGYLDCHAFFVEMTAKTLKSKRTLTAETVRDKFKSGEFSTIERKKKKSFNDYLNELFSFDGLDDEEILMLKQFSVLPSIEIEFKFLEEIFNRKDEEEFEEILKSLYIRGLLISTSNSYKLHQIIKEYILNNYLPSFNEIKKIFDFLHNTNSPKIEYLLSFYRIVKLIENKKSNFIISFLERLDIKIIKKIIFISKFIVEEEKINIKKLTNQITMVINFYQLISSIYYAKGEYKKALKICLEYKHKHILVFNEISFFSKDNIYLAQIYEQLGEKEKELSLYMKSLEIKKKYCENKCLSIASNYRNLAIYYRKNKKYNDSIKYFKKSLEIYINKLGKENTEVAFIYNSLGVLYSSMDDEKALNMYSNSLRIYSKIGNNNKMKYLVYNNLGLYYLSKSKFKKAYRYINKSLNLRKEFLVIDDDIVHSYKYFSLLYYKLNRLDDAYFMINKAIEMIRYMYPENKNHPDLIDSKEWLEMIERVLKKNL